MRSKPIEPAELRQFLVSKVKQVKAQTMMEERDQKMMISALEWVRHEFLNDLSFYDQEPS